MTDDSFTKSRFAASEKYKAESLTFLVAVNINFAVMCYLDPCSLVDALLRNVPIYLPNLMTSVTLILFNITSIILIVCSCCNKCKFE
jgi:hypothetical protein